jgi:methylated-DNA-[protein]-cysteine S-methyltransferase
MTTIHAIIPSILGDIILVADDYVLTGLYQPLQPNIPAHLGERVDSVFFSEAVHALDDYLSGESTILNVENRLQGTQFQKAVWETIQAIPYGETRTYLELATALGKPQAVRAVATAVGRNPITVIIPCHRVVSRGNKVNYSGGAENKLRLLDIESR